MRVVRPIMLMAMLVSWSALHAQRADNYPPDNTNVRLEKTNLPIVFVEVDHAMILRTDYITARMKIIDNGKGNFNYADTVAHPGQHIDYNGYIALRYRGNTSFSQCDKKPYAFRPLDKPLENGGEKKKVSLLGMGKDNKWALLAPYSDKSMLRDLLTFEVSRPWMDYTPQGRYCEIFLDGIYYGVYILTEVISKGAHRLNLDDPGESGDELTGGYLLEVDSYDGSSCIQSRYLPRSSSGTIYSCPVYYLYQSPDYEDMTPEQIQYIKDQINAMEKAMASNDYCDPLTGYRRYIDEMSFVDFQLAQELSHNVDGYRKSSKFFKHRDSQDPRFKMAIWDFNIAYGNYWKYENWRTDTWIYQSNDILYNNGDRVLVPFWWYQLNRDPYYTGLVKARWKQYRRNNVSDERIMATIDSLATVLTQYGAESRNSQAWPRWGVRVWPNYYVANSYQDEIQYLKNWLTARLAWMDEQLEYIPGVYIRGDLNDDGLITIDDVTCLIDYLLDGSNDIATESADCNQDGTIDITDVTTLIDYLLNDKW